VFAPPEGGGAVPFFTGHDDSKAEGSRTMAPRFLTQDWATAATEALGASGDVRSATKEVDLTIQQVVTGAPDGEVRYFTRFDDGHVTVGIGEAEDHDVVITQDHATAVELNQGQMNAQAAFMQGKLSVGGNMAKLLQNQVAVQAVGAALAEVPTSY
jgi:putative sterol carrier protein